MDGLKKYRKIVDDKLADRRVLSTQLFHKEAELDSTTIKLADAKVGLILIQKSVALTQEQLESHISNIVTLALEAVEFSDPYRFVMKFETRRNSSECDLLFECHGELFRPMDGGAGGEKDIASFALRCAYQVLEGTRNTMILDEPFKNVSVDLQPSAGEMLRMVSKELGMQIIMNSHLPNMIDCGDKIFEMTKYNLPVTTNGKTQNYKVSKVST